MGLQCWSSAHACGLCFEYINSDFSQTPTSSEHIAGLFALSLRFGATGEGYFLVLAPGGNLAARNSIKIIRSSGKNKNNCEPDRFDNHRPFR
jgi:hypothetical protein